MTIREYIATRAQSVRNVTIILGVIFLVTCSIVDTIAKLQINSWYLAGAAGVFIFTVMHIGMSRIRCPRCGGSLRRLAYIEISSTHAPATSCPQCAVSLDQPMSHNSLVATSHPVLTSRQAESAATALAMKPETERSDMLTCPVCGRASISQSTRRQMSLLKQIPCPECGTLLRLKLGRAVLAAYLGFVILVGVVAYLTWPTHHRVIQSLATSCALIMILILATTLRRLPLVAA